MKLPKVAGMNLAVERLRGRAEAEVVGYDTFLWSVAVIQAYSIAFAAGLLVGAVFLNIFVGVFVGVAAAALTATTPLVQVLATPLYKFHEGRRLKSDPEPVDDSDCWSEFLDSEP